jgi:hypothetical protein
VAERRGRRSELFYSIRRDDWARLLGITEGEIPQHGEWIQTLGALRLVLRWLSDDRTESLSDYMRASEACVLLEELEPDLRFAGFAVDGRGVTGTDYWDAFGRTIEDVLTSL